MKFLLKLMPWCFLALFATEIVAVLMPKKDGDFHVREFGRLPVLLSGRVQPFDSVARNSLLQIRSTADVPLEFVTNRLGRVEEWPGWKFWHHPAKLKSTAWLLEVMARPDAADTRPIFLIHHPDLLGELRLGGKGVENSGLHYYSYDELKPVLGEIASQGQRANGIDASLRSPLERQVLKLANALALYVRLKTTLNPAGLTDLNAELDRVQAVMGPGIAAFTAQEENKPFDQAAYDTLLNTLNQYHKVQGDEGAGQMYPLVIPPVNPDVAWDAWGNIGYGVMESVRAREILPPLRWLATSAVAYHDNNPAGFNEAVADYGNWLAQHFPAELVKGKREFFFNETKGFLHAMIIYMCAFVLSAIGLLAFGTFPNLFESLRRSAFYLILLAGVVHTAGLIFRMVLEGRPPVTNLYSSAIFIGWGAVVLGVFLEWIYRVGIGNLVAALAGFVTLLIAHNMATGGDTMEMLRAVLDTNFWLATHVVIVTLGYASTFVAGLLAVLYIFLGFSTPLLSRPLGERGAAAVAAGAGLATMAVTSPVVGIAVGAAAAKGLKKNISAITIGTALTKMVYGIVCFATLFSFVGTVLGGIWADQSWGRFWGWDPKENGALLIVIWNATILHARWGGMVRERGLMNMAVFGNIVTSFSWFGVNLLGIGLHSYGFTDTGAEYLMNFVLGQVVLIGNGIMPLMMWKGARTQLAAEFGSFFRKILALFDCCWVVGAIVWAASIYCQQHAVGIGSIFLAVPWLGIAGKAAVCVCVFLVWALAVVAWIVHWVSTKKPEAAAGSPTSISVAPKGRGPSPATA